MDKITYNIGVVVKHGTRTMVYFMVYLMLYLIYRSHGVFIENLVDIHAP